MRPNLAGPTLDLTAYLDKVAAEESEYYLLGYTPATDSADGTCHDLKVTVDRGGLAVRARKGYCTPAQPGTLPAQKTLDARAA